MRKRRALNKTERLAAALLEIKRGDEWLIPEPIRSSGDAAAICACVQWDHRHPHAQGGTNDPQNMQPLLKDEHQAKTKRDVAKIARDKRLTKKHEEARRQMLSKETNELTYVKPKKGKSQCEYTRLKHIFKRKVQGGKVVLRSEDRKHS
jgi:hypothetical protein